MNAFHKWMILLLPAIVLAGCSQTETPQAGGVPRVYTTFYPTTYFTRQIAGDRVKVVCPLPAEEDPIFWKPSRKTISEYQQADRVVINGAGFEKWVATASLPSSKVVDTARPLADEFLKFQGNITHSHGPGGQHSHEGVDGHTWLDPNHAKVQANEIRKALAERLPEHADEFQANYVALAGELDTLDRSLVELSKTLADRHLLASHPAYNYLVDRYDWNLTNLDLDPQTMPDDATMAEIRLILESKPSKLILWESSPAEEVAARFQEELGLAGIVFSPCETLEEAAIAEGENYLTVMKENVQRLRQAAAP